MNTPDDDLHDPELSALYRQLPDAEPGADTDAQLRAAARRAVRAGPRQWLFSFETRRLMGAAAMLLIGVGLVLQWQAREPRALEEAIGPAPVLRVEPQSEEAAPADAIPAAPAAAPARKAAPARTTPPPATTENRVADSSAAPTPAAPPATKKETADVANLASEEAVSGAEQPVAQAAPAPTAELRLGDQARRSEALRRPEAAASARERKSAQMERQLAAPPADYRELMTLGRPAEALAAVAGVDTTAAIIDRDLLRQLLGDTSVPQCLRLAEATLGDETRLCDFLAMRHRNQPLPADWRRQLEEEGLISGRRDYRRHAVETLFAPQPGL